jgi:hypothetical protein
MRKEIRVIRVRLADERVDWRPTHYETELLGCRVQFDFPVCKLVDLVEQAKTVLNEVQPSAVMIVANWAAQQTRSDMAERRRVKWDLTRRLYDAGYSRKDILELYRLVDWLLRLPDRLEQEFKQQVSEYERSMFMPYVTSIERLAKEEGRTEALIATILRQSRYRWKVVTPEIEKCIQALPVERLENLTEALLGFDSPSELEAWLAAAETQTT